MQSGFIGRESLAFALLPTYWIIKKRWHRPFKQTMENPIAPEVEVKSTIVEPVTTKNQEEMVTLTKAQAEELIKAAEDATKLAQKKSDDAENYRKGMLKYKTKLKDDYGDEDDDEVAPQLSEERIAQIFKEQLQAVMPQTVKPQEEELEKSKLVISELKTALANR
ncbi:MAG: hypothetical protein NT043_00025, partial [Candidatus Bathyarchaeota archaeon]|nr:hypothetical protein [Candidatus Bathyarchaeota archaeon]